MSDNDQNVIRSTIIAATGRIAGGYLAGNSVLPSDLPELIKSTYRAIAEAAGSSIQATATAEATEQQSAQSAEPVLKPAVDPKKSVFPDYIICLEDGKHFRMLKRHLSTTYNLTPEQYRIRWGLPSSYPMVSPNYAETRSQLAVKMGLGRQGKGRTQQRKVVTKTNAKVPTGALRGRPRKNSVSAVSEAR